MTEHGRAWTTANPLTGMRRVLATPVSSVRILAGLGAAVAAFVSIAISPNSVGLAGAGLALVVVAIAVIDGHSFVIPNGLIAAGLALATWHAAVLRPEAMLENVAIAAIRGIVLACVLLIVRIVYARVRGRQGLGLGDVKLAIVAGAWLDWLTMAIAIELAAVAALSGYVLRQMILRRSFSATHRLPFGLFFAPAIWICWVLETLWLAS